jgi:hippurate hydrolase
VAAEMILALQTAVTRQVDAFDPAVLTIGHVAAGTTYNVIPESAFLEGTFRCVSDARRAAMPGLIERVVHGVAAAHGLGAELRFQEIYPVTVCDPGVAEQVRAIAADLVGAENVATMPAPMMAAEDWSFVLQRVPGAMANLGARPRDRALEGFPQNHSSRVVFEEAAMAVGAALHAKVALEL